MGPGTDLAMLTPDGVALASRIFRPEGDGPWPVLLMRQPYGLAIASTVTYAHPSWYARAGFLVVVQDVRGRGESGGEFGGFRQEGADGAAAVRWVRDLPGSNGRVGTYGFSYQGLSQLLNDGDGPSLPDCLVPAMCGVDERLHWASEGGAHWWSLGLGWALQLAAEGCRRRRDDEGWLQIRRSLEGGAYLHEGLALLERHDPDGMGLDWLRRDPGRPEQWRLHPVAQELLRRPMLLIGGWHDPQLRGVLDLYRQARAAGGQPELRLGAWSHLNWQGGIDDLQLEFFRRHLQAAGPAATCERTAAAPAAVAASAPAAPESEPVPSPLSQVPPVSSSSPGTGPAAGSAAGPGTTPAPASLPSAASAAGASPGAATALGEPGRSALALQCIRTGFWRDQAPPPEAIACQGWVLASSGLAGIRTDEGRLLAANDRNQEPGWGRLSLVHDPWRPTPSRGGHLGPDPGLAERRDLDQRAEVACFTSAALPAALRLLGEPRLRLIAWADQPGFDLWASLSVLTPDGAVQQLCTGGLRRLGNQCLISQPAELALQPLDATLQAGECLRLSLAPAAWPAFALNPGDGSLPRGGVGPQHRVITIELDLSGSRFWLESLSAAN
ncbi:MAG: CocE/NonD family hydrolase [Cyanobium sp.]